MCSIRAKGKQIMPPFIIFKGRGYISQKEADFLDSQTNIRWTFQKRAWADAQYTRKWLRCFIDTLQKNGLGDKQTLLLLDDLTSQKTDRCLALAMQKNIFPFLVPPGCTDLVS